MAAKTKRVEIEVAAKDRATGVFERAIKRLDDLKRVAGGRGPIKDIAELAKGGGALAGLTFAARAVGDLGENIAKLARDLRDPNVSAREMAENLALSIPIGGHIVRGLQAVTPEILRAVGASDQLVARFTSAARAAEEVKQVLASFEQIKGVFGGAFNLGDSFTDRIFGNRLRGSALDEFKLRRQAQKDEEAIRKLEAERDKLPTDEQGQIARAGITDTIARLRRQAELAQNEEEKALRRKRNADFERLTIEGETRIGDLKAKFRSEDLKRQKKDLDAELLEIERTYQKEIRAAQERAVAVSETAPELTGFAEGQAKREFEILGQLRDQAIEIARGRHRGGPIDPNPTASLLSSRFIAGQAGNDPALQPARQTATNTNKIATQQDRWFTRIDRTLGDMLRELINQRTRTTSGAPTSPAF